MDIITLKTTTVSSNNNNITTGERTSVMAVITIVDGVMGRTWMRWMLFIGGCGGIPEKRTEEQPEEAIIEVKHLALILSNTMKNTYYFIFSLQPVVLARRILRSAAVCGTAVLSARLEETLCPPNSNRTIVTSDTNTSNTNTI